MDIVVALAFVALVVIAADRLMLSLSRRGYVYWRRDRRRESARPGPSGSRTAPTAETTTMSAAELDDLLAGGDEARRP